MHAALLLKLLLKSHLSCPPPPHTHTLHVFNSQGPWTEHEDARLRELQGQLGNRWKEIGSKLGRHPESVVDRWNNLGKGKTIKTGGREIVSRGGGGCLHFSVQRGVSSVYVQGN